MARFDDCMYHIRFHLLSEENVTGIEKTYYIVFDAMALIQLLPVMS